jgi:hypothetical protein
MSTTPTKADYLEEALRGFAPMDATEALRRLQVLVQSEPNFRAIQEDHSCPPETLKWLGQLHAIVRAMKLAGDEVALNVASGMLVRSKGQSGGGEIRTVLYRALATAELAAPASEQGAFIAAGNELDAYAAISKLLAAARHDLLVVDPYMDGKALTDFLPSAAEGVRLRVLTDEATVKETLAPAADKWKAQFEAKRPLEVRLAPGRSLHDRLIMIDEGEVWSLSQSLKDFANRAHGSILKTDAETAALKIGAYDRLWNDARPS